MINWVIAWSLDNRFLVLLATAAIIGGGIWAMMTTPLDAIPDLSDVQVIVQTDFREQAPQIVEDQITYPIASEMLKVPGARVVRGFSFFGLSLVYVIFEDGTDIYWARSRVLEYLNGIRQQLPTGIEPVLGPDATGVGWVFEYVLESDSLILAELRTLQDWYIRYQLTAVPGVSEVASLGGFVEAVPGRGGPGAASRLRYPGHARRAGDRRAQHRHRRSCAGDGRPRVHDPRPGISGGDRGHPERRRRCHAERHADPGRRRRHRPGWSRPETRRGRSGWAGRGRRRDRSDALRVGRAEDDRGA